MVNVYLHGRIGQKFGKQWLGIAAKTASEAFHAIDVNVKGLFRQYLATNPDKQYKIKIGNEFINDNNEATGPCGSQDIHLVPVIKGRKSGAGKIFAAIAIIAITYFTAGLGTSAAVSFAGAIGTTTTALAAVGYSIGASLLLGGISQILAPKANLGNTAVAEQDKNNSSYFNGGIDAVRQGYPVPVAYGEVMIEPLPISVSYFHENLTVGGSENETEVIVNTNPNYADPRIVPESPVGLNISAVSNSNAYLGLFNNTVTPPGLPPPRIPIREEP